MAVLVGAYRARGLRVAVLAVDPSSPAAGRCWVTGSDGSPHQRRRRAVRSVAAAGIGGLAAAVPAAIRLLAALAYDIDRAFETVGVGPVGVEIGAVADPTILILNPGAGDASRQPRRACWVADLVVVNKDRRGSRPTVRDLRAEPHAPI